MSAEIGAVFFDIGNVLLRFDPHKMAAKIAWRLRANPLQIAKFVWQGGFVEDVERGKIGPRQLYEIFRDKLGFDGTQAQFANLWCDHFTLDRTNAALLRRVAKTRKVYLLSNTNELHYEFIRKNYAFPGDVHGAVLSHELGLRKPERAIYEKAAELAGLPAPRCLFIDDLEPNVAGARKAGFQAIHHAKGHDLRAAFETLGLL